MMVLAFLPIVYQSAFLFYRYERVKKGTLIMKKILALLLVSVIVLSLFAACGENGGGGTATEPADREPGAVDNSTRIVMFGNAGWDSNQLHNAIAGFIAETAFGYGGWDELFASSAVIHEALLRGDIDIHGKLGRKHGDVSPRPGSRPLPGARNQLQ